jgi:aryl-alcohol dehydrogenase
MQTGAGAVTTVLRPGSSVPARGLRGGGVGLAAVMAARALGVETVVAVELRPERLAAAESMGATAVLDGGSPDITEQIRAATGGGATHGLGTTAV